MRLENSIAVEYSRELCESIKDAGRLVEMAAGLKADLEKLKSSRPVAKAAPADNGPTDGAAKPAEK